MNKTLDLIARLKGAGVRLTLEEQRLKIHAPKGKLSPGLLAELKTGKEAIIAFLQQHAGGGEDLPPIEPVEKKEYYPLSSAQKRLYILWEMLADLSAYNISYTAQIEGNLKAAKLRDVFCRLISVHESLRTSFLMVAGQPVQRVHEQVDFELEVFSADGRGGQGPERCESLALDQQLTIIQGFIRPFDLGKAPLLRVCLIKTGEETHILLVDMHHIISDGTSMGIIIRDFLSFYSGTELHPLAVQYKDYAEWQNRLETREANHRMQTFWLHRFRGEIPVLNFPLDFPRPATQSFAGNTRSFFIGTEETKALKNLALKEEVTPYMLLLAVFYVFLARLCGQEDIVVGTPTAGREFPVIEPAVGMFVNTLALRAYPKGEKTFSDFLKEVKETVLESFQNQRYPFEELVDQVVKTRDTGRNPLFDVLFTLEARDRQYDREIPGLKLTPYPFENKTAKFDLALTARDTDNGFGFYLEYCTRLFKEESIRRYIVYYLRVLESVAQRPGITLAEVDILPGEEREQVLLAFNDTAVDYPREKLIQEIFAEQVVKSPDRTALSDETFGANGNSPLHGSVSYKELDRCAAALAGELIEKGVLPNSIVGLQVGRSIEMIVGILGILKAGAAYLPLDPDLPEARIDYMLADSGAEIVIGPQTVGANCCSPIQDIGAECKGERQFAPTDLAYVMYTSGSTGQPKGVMVCHGNVIRLVINPNFIDLSAATRLLLTGAPGFDATTFEIWGPLLNGGLLCLVSKEIILDAQRLGSTLKDFQVNTLWLSAPLFNQLLEQDSRMFNSLTWLLVGGDVLSPVHINRVRRENKGLKVINGYGPTENTTFSTCLEIERDYEERIPIGRPISNSAVYILDARGRVQPVGVKGEIWVGGDGLARGYLNNPELTEERFVFSNLTPLSPQDNRRRQRWERDPKERSSASTPSPSVERGDWWSGAGDSRCERGAAAIPGTGMLNRIAESPQFVKPQAKLSTVLAGSEGDWCVSPAPHQSPLTTHLYKTGDRGRWLDDGTIEFLGRVDDQVKIRGFRIEPGEIEARLLRHPEVKEAVVLAREGESGDKVLCAYLVPHTPGKETDILETEVRGFLSGSLPDYLVPGHFVFLEQIPLTANGKVDRKALPEPEVKAGARYTAPRTDFERRLVELFSEVLRRDAGATLPAIGIDDDFFALGGHSLKATTLTYRLREEFSVPVRIGDIFSLRTIRALAQKLQGLESFTYQAITPMGVQDHYELSYAQRRLWVLCQFEEDSAAYNIPGAMLLEGKPDLVALKRTFQSLVDRHESLRTSFVMIDGQPRQKVWVGLEVDVPVFDLRQLDEGEKESQAREIHRQTGNHAFHLEQAPLTLLRVLRLGEEKTMLTWNTHHIVDDGWSEGIIANDFIRLYNAYSQGLENPLPALTLQYKDYSQWHNNLIAGDRFSVERQYWLEKFKDKPTGIDLPLDFPRQSIQTFNGGRLQFVLQPGQTRGLRGLSARCDGTLFMGLLTLLSVFLYRYSGQRDILLGAPIANRKQVELQPLVGFFVNTLVYRVSVDPQKSFLAQLTEVKEEALRCYEYQDYPFDLLVEELGLERDLSQSPLFNVMIAHNNAGTGEEGLGLRGLRPLAFPFADEVNMSKFDLIFFMDERGDDVVIRIEYNSDLFRQERIGRMVAHFLELTGQVLLQPQSPVCSLGLVAGAEYRQVVHEFNDHPVDFPAVTIQEMVEAQVERTPDQIAVVGDTLPGVSYRELNGRANRLAHYLRREHNIRRNDIIGVSMGRSIDMIVVLLAIIKSGAAYLAVDPTYPRERVLHVLQDSQIALLIIDKMREELFGGYTGTVIDIHDRAAAIAGQPQDNPPALNQLADILYVNYTSGSTGTPNGAMLSHDCLTNLIQWQNEKSGVDCSLRVLQFTSINFCVSFQEIMGTLTSGGELHLIGDIERQETDYLLDFLAARAIEVLFVPFSYLNFLFNETSRWDKDFRHHLQHIATAGEQLKVTAGLKRFLDKNPHIKLHNHYGSTEMHVVTSYTLDAATAGQTPIPPAGKPVSNVRIFILDENLQVVPLGVWGELCVEGREEILGYINNRELTEKKLIRQESLSGKRLYRSGDIGRWLADGNIELRGRKDFMVKVRGFRVELGEIESRVLGVKGVRECVVVVKEDSKGIKNLVAYVSLDGVEVAEVRRAISGVLPQYMVPRFVVVDGLPLMPNGKVDREKLPEPQFEVEGVKIVQPRDEIEQRLSAIWAELLGLEAGQIGIDDNFFEKGGHSLKATRMVGQIHREANVKIPLSELFRAPTIRAMAEFIRKAAFSTFEELKNVEEKEYYELSYNQERLLVLYQLDPQNPAFNLGGAIPLTGAVDKGLIRRVLQALVDRHESMRTYFCQVKGIFVQVIQPKTVIDLEWVDISALEETERVRVRWEHHRLGQVIPFTLDIAPLFRVKLLKYREDEYDLLFTMHHIISDGWSMEVLEAEFHLLYGAYKKGLEEELEPSIYRYRDYAGWQKRMLENKESMAGAREFFAAQLGQGYPGLNLPVDYPKTRDFSRQCAAFRAVMPPGLTGALWEMARANKASMFMVLLAAFNIFLSRITGQNDILVGFPGAARPHDDLKNIIGFFVNTLIIRLQIRPDEPFTDFLARVQVNCLQVLEYQSFPLELVCNELKIKYPEISVFFNMSTFGPIENKYVGNPNTIHFQSAQDTKFDLEYYITECRDGIELRLHYPKALFAPMTIEKMMAKYLDILESISTGPGENQGTGEMKQKKRQIRRSK